MRVELHPEARAELRAAAIWYEERRPRLGEEFLAEVSVALKRIGATPNSFPHWHKTEGAPKPIRKVSVRRFPYVLAFEAHHGSVLVLAVAHGKRKPLYWLSRADPEAV